MTMFEPTTMVPVVQYLKTQCDNSVGFPRNSLPPEDLLLNATTDDVTCECYISNIPTITGSQHISNDRKPVDFRDDLSIESEVLSYCEQVSQNTNEQDTSPAVIDASTVQIVTNKLEKIFDFQERGCGIIPRLEKSTSFGHEDFACPSGVQYTNNILSVPSAELNEKILPPSVPRIDGIFIRKGQNTTFGSKIVYHSDLILNQYVDLSKEVQSSCKLTLTGSMPSKHFSLKNSCFLPFILITIVIVIVLLVGITLSTNSVFFEEYSTHDGEDPTPRADALVNYTLKVIARAQWSAFYHRKLDELPIKPARLVIVSHTVSGFCETPSNCLETIRTVESWQIETGLTAIGYAFLIGGDGFIYEGRGWGKYGAHTYGYNCNSVGVGFIGNFDKYNITTIMLDALNILIEEGVRGGAISANYKLLGQNQVTSFSSPGINIRSVIKSWPHWTGQVTQEDKCIKK